MDITKEELEKIRTLKNKISELKSVVADCSVQIYRLNSMKEDSVSQLSKLGSEWSLIQDEMLQKYGEANINLKTGEIVHGD